MLILSHHRPRGEVVEYWVGVGGSFSLLSSIPENDVADDLAENVDLRMGCEENRASVLAGSISTSAASDR